MSVAFIAKFWSWVEYWFVSPRLIPDPITRRKARILASAHFFVILMLGLIALLSAFFTPENNVSEWNSIFLFAFSSVIFKRQGNFDLSGNILAFDIAFILVPMVFETGGLYSDNVLWLLLCPMAATFFCNRHYEFFWYGALIAFTVFLYKTIDPGITIPLAAVKDFSPTYMMISYTTFFSMVCGIVLLFKMGNQQIIQSLQENQEYLLASQQKLEQKNAILHELSDKLSRSNRDLESFAYASSHDLKEPLRMIGLYTQLIKKRLAGQLEGDTLEFMGYVTTGVSRMQRLLDDLLEYSRVGRGEDKIKRIDLNDVMFYVRTNLKVAIMESSAQLDIPETLPHVSARYSEMVQLFQNLISNAIKFRKKDVPLAVSISCQEANGFFEFRVSDNGIGIAPEFQSRVFNIFERIHSKSDYEGSGIGLATVKKIIQGQGGAISVESELGMGTTFCFTLPVEYQPKQFVGEDEVWLRAS